MINNTVITNFMLSVASLSFKQEQTWIFDRQDWNTNVSSASQSNRCPACLLPMESPVINVWEVNRLPGGFDVVYTSYKNRTESDSVRKLETFWVVEQVKVFPTVENIRPSNEHVSLIESVLYRLLYLIIKYFERIH